MENASERYNVFVYGTLKDGYWNNRVMTEGGDARKVGDAYTAARYLLYSAGIPYVARLPEVPGPRRLLWPFLGQILGEVWSIDKRSLEACDGLEGNGRYYNREEVPVIILGVEGPRAFAQEAWLYFIMRLPDGLPVRPVDGLLEWDRNKSRHAPDDETSYEEEEA